MNLAWFGSQRIPRDVVAIDHHPTTAASADATSARVAHQLFLCAVRVQPAAGAGPLTWIHRNNTQRAHSALGCPSHARHRARELNLVA